MRTRPLFCAALAVSIASMIVSCAGSPGSPGSAGGSAATSPAPASQPMPTMADAKAKDFPGIHNAVAYSDGFVSGSVPEGDAGFDTLQGMGVKTIISVDGAVPDVASAQARGIRYIHLPIGYNGFDNERKLQLVRATRDAMKDGPVYIHCHHGKHRSAGAAAAVAASLGWVSNDDGIDRMKVSGTAPNYKGLYACAQRAEQLSDEVVNAVPANFASVWKPSDFVAGMVEIGEVVEHLKAIDKAGWTAPKDHPDLVPVAEAGRLADLYRVLAATDASQSRPGEFGEWMRRSQAEAQALEDALEKSTGLKASQKSTDLSAHLKTINASCKSCHAKYRD